MPRKMSAEYCRQRAIELAGSMDDTNDSAWRAALATQGSFWIQLGQFCLAVGDPDEDVLKTRERREMMASYPVRP